MNKILQAKELLAKHIAQQCSAKQFRLPPERTLAEQFGYSRATIGKALGVLEGEGLVLRKRGDGTYITHRGEKPTLTIALLMRGAYHCTDPHFRLIVDEVSRYSAKNNIYIQIFDNIHNVFKDDPDNNSLMLSIKNNIIDGVLIASRMNMDIIGRISKACPTVAINNIFGSGNDISCISCDYFRVGFLAGKYLLDKGHRKIAYITDYLTHPHLAFELSGLRSALEMNNILLKDTDVLETKQDSALFSKKILNFFKGSAYTACFVRRSTHALKIISILQNNGIKVPEDISIISESNFPNNKKGTVQLTVVDDCLSEMCHAGLDALRHIYSNNNKTEGGLKLLEPKIIEHNSVIKLK